MSAAPVRNGRAQPPSSPAAAHVISAVPAWWAERARLADLPLRWQDWRRALPRPPVELVDRHPAELATASGHALGEAYACELPQAERVRHGRHYTPKPLADALWAEIERTGVAFPPGPIVDPAGGAGALLLAPVRRFVAERAGAEPASTLREAAARFAGIDTDPRAVWLGNAILAAELLPLWARVPETERAPLPTLMSCGDGLDVPQESAAIVVMNPPFGRAALDAEARVRWAPTLFGHANWYGVFLQAAVERAAQGGVVAAVLPTSFLGGAYYQRLRRFLAEQAPLVRLRLIDDRSGVFASGVLQETCLAVFHKGATGGSVTCSSQRINGRMHSSSLGGTVLSRRGPSGPWLLPRATTDRRLIGAAAGYEHRLSDYGWSASTGPLVWNRHKARISGDAGPGRLPILWAADIEMDGVRRSAARDLRRWIELRERDRFMELSGPAVVVQRTTAPEQPRRLVAAALTADLLTRDWGGAVVVENHVNVLRCRRPDSPLSTELLTALLNSQTIDRIYRCMTGTVAVSAYELDSLPLPPAEVLRAWQALHGSELAAAIARAFS